MRLVSLPKAWPRQPLRMHVCSVAAHSDNAACAWHCLTVPSDLFNISLNGATVGSANTIKSQKSPWTCSNPFRLTCMEHGEEIAVRCKRWRACPGCSLWKQLCLTQRFVAGIESVPAGKMPMFFTLTFPLAQAPDEDEAHRAWRSLVARLRYRDYLGEYGWVLQRQRQGTLHFHGVAHLPWFSDGLAEWRQLLRKSGFGVQNKLVVAERQHATYCAKYISTRLAELAPLRRAYGFSASFPQSKFEANSALLAERYGIVLDSDCAWTPSYELYS
jgi:hypothetical protein